MAVKFFFPTSQSPTVIFLTLTSTINAALLLLAEYTLPKTKTKLSSLVPICLTSISTLRPTYQSLTLPTLLSDESPLRQPSFSLKPRLFQRRLLLL